MKVKKRKAFVHILTAFWLMFTGICMTENHAYSILLHRDALCTSCCSLKSSNRAAAEELCTSELLGQKLPALGEKRSEESKVNGNSYARVLFVVPETLSKDSQFLSWTVSGGFHHEIHSRTVILNYIHRKDGRKPAAILPVLV